MRRAPLFPTPKSAPCGAPPTRRRKWQLHFSWTCPNVKMIKGLGGLGDPNNDIHATELVRRASRALGCRLALLPSPSVAASIAVRDAFYSDSYVAQILSLARSADLAFVGIGFKSSSP